MNNVTLPIELWRAIFKHSLPPEIAVLSSVSLQFHRLSKERKLWHFFIKKFLTLPTMHQEISLVQKRYIRSIVFEKNQLEKMLALFVEKAINGKSSALKCMHLPSFSCCGQIACYPTNKMPTSIEVAYEGAQQKMLVPLYIKEIFTTKRADILNKPLLHREIAHAPSSLTLKSPWFINKEALESSYKIVYSLSTEEPTIETLFEKTAITVASVLKIGGR